MTMMTPEAFTRLLDTHGAEPARWPEAHREAALRLCETSPEAQARWMEAGRLDALLAAGRTARREPAREARIVAAAMARIRARAELVLDWRWLFTRSMRVALAACLVAGWFVGVGFGDDAPRQTLAGDIHLEDLIQ